MESLLDTFGPLILAFIALVFYGLRVIFKSTRIKQEADEDQPSTERASGGNSSDFVFSDPLETSVPVARNKENHTLTTAATDTDDPKELSVRLRALQQEFMRNFTQPRHSAAPTPHHLPDGPLATEQHPSAPTDVSPGAASASPVRAETVADSTKPPQQRLRGKLRSTAKRKLLKDSILMAELLQAPRAMKEHGSGMRKF